MRQFINGNEGLLQEVEDRAQDLCIRYRSQEMPAGSTPGTADIGFEIDSESGQSILYVSRGVHCFSCSDNVRAWLDTGLLSFNTFTDLKKWLSAELADSYPSPNSSGDGHPRPLARESTEPEARELTDFTLVEDAISDMHNPLYLDEDELLSLLSRKVHGQEFALKGLSAAVARHCARRRPTSPAVIFATGPSGVGKTRSAISVSQVLHSQDHDNVGYGFLRLDMAEYQEGHRVSQLIGAPQGYTGHGEGSQLVDALLANPRTIVLFDEIEKAHPSILRVLMNAMDAGRLSTASRTPSGHEIDCRQSIFIFTSNLMSKEIIDELNSRNAFADQPIIDEVCRRRFQAGGILPEIIGRIGKFLVFIPLTAKVRARIVTMAIAEVAMEYGIDVQYVAPEIVVDLMKKNRTHDLGVRPEKYMIDDMLGGVFARAAKDGIDIPVKVVGPPLKCLPYDAEDPCAEKTPPNESKK